MRRTLRVLQVIWSLDLGGAERIVIDLVNGLTRPQFEPVVCCLYGKGRCAADVERRGTRVLALEKRRTFEPSLIVRLARIMRRERIDVVHTHMFNANLWGRLGAVMAGVPVIASEHGMDEWRHGPYLLADRMLAPITTRIVCVSDAVTQFYEARLPVLRRKGLVIRNGVDCARFRAPLDTDSLRNSIGIRQEAFVVGVVGRLAHEKAHGDFIDALARVVRRQPQVMGLIVGDGPLAASLRLAAERANIAQNVVFTGFRHDVADVLRIMDVLVLCSMYEGLPVALLEAMAGGVPVVATAVGGIPECIEHGRDGLLVPPANVGALAAALELMIESPELRRALSRHARERIDASLTVKHMVASYEALYRDVARADARRA